MTATIIIDRKKIQVPDEMTVLEAARSAGIHIPTLCHHAELSPVGSCRVCLVEVDGVNDPVASCMTKVQDGMAVQTDSERLRSVRRAMVELLLVDHPLECPVCDKAGECELQDIVHELGLMEPQYEPIGIEREINEVNAFIGRYPNRCIVCGRCVRACEEVQGAGVMNYVKREGYEGEVAMVARDPGECEQCGQCLRVCPVGALIEQSFKYRARAWELHKTATTCPHCAMGCTLTLNTKQGRILRVTSETPGLSGGNLCVRGRFGFDFAESEDRLQFPLIRVSGELRRAEWDEALAVAAAGLDGARRSDGPGSIAVFGSPRCTNEENYQLQKFARAVLGTNNIDFMDRPSCAGTLDGIEEATGARTAATNSVDALETVGSVLVVDSDISESQPMLALPVLRAVRQKGAALVVIDARRTKMARQSTHWLNVRAGSEEVVLGAIVRFLCENGRVEGLEQDELSGLLESLVECGLERAEQVSGVDATKMAGAAEALASSGSVAVLISALAGRETASLACDLVSMTEGNGGGVYAAGLPANWQGAVDMGVTPSRLPGGADIRDERARAAFETAWGAAVPAAGGMSAHRLLEQAEKGAIRAALVMGDSFSSAPSAVAALGKVDFVVVQDTFAGPLLECASVVLPSTSFAEKRGTFTNMERYVQRVRPALPPLGEARADTEILAEIAGHLGVRLESKPGLLMREVSSVCPSYAEVTYDLMESGPVRTIASETNAAGGKTARLVPASPSLAVEDDGRYPLRLVAGSRRFHSGAQSGKARGLKEAYPEPAVEVNPADAELLGLKDSVDAIVRTPHGEHTLKVKLTLKSSPGTVFIPLGFAAAATLLGWNGSAPATKTVAILQKREAGE